MLVPPPPGESAAVIVIYGEEASAVALSRVYERTALFAALLLPGAILLVTYNASCGFARSHMDFLPHASPREKKTTNSNDGRSRAWSAEWQHSGKIDKRCPAPRAQPRCKPFIRSRPDGPTRPRDPTKRPG